METQPLPNNPSKQDKESPFRFPEKLPDEQVVAIATQLGLHIDWLVWRDYEKRARVYWPEKRRFRKPAKDIIFEGISDSPATAFRQALSALEAEVAEQLDPETLLVSRVRALQTHDTLIDRVMGGWYCAKVRHKGRETSERVTLEVKRVRNPDEYRRNVRRRLPDLIAERQGRARTLGAELRQAYESVVLGH